MGAGRRCPDGGEGRGIQGAHGPLERPVVLVPERACPRLLGPTSRIRNNLIERLVVRAEFLTQHGGRDTMVSLERDQELQRHGEEYLLGYSQAEELRLK